jgi:hypothetical protein
MSAYQTNVLMHMKVGIVSINTFSQENEFSFANEIILLILCIKNLPFTYGYNCNKSLSMLHWLSHAFGD